MFPLDLYKFHFLHCPFLIIIFMFSFKYVYIVIKAVPLFFLPLLGLFLLTVFSPVKETFSCPLASLVILCVGGVAL